MWCQNIFHRLFEEVTRHVKDRIFMLKANSSHETKDLGRKFTYW